MRIFITGVTGFLGYHIALGCLKAGHELLCLKRSASILPIFSIKEERQQICWVTKGENNWKQIISNFQPDILIHCAWEGTTAQSRNNELIQHSNIQLLVDLIMIFPYKQVICLGSQDEYGYLDGIIDENYILSPQSEYAKAKISCCQQLAFLASEKNFEWQWIRLFSVYGEKQGDTWFIPSLIKKCLANEAHIPLTKCEQIYAYLYSDDFVFAILLLLGSKEKSGIYNLSSSYSISLKNILFLIKRLTNSKATFDFGFYPYRPYQSMMICGDSSKFIRLFGPFERTSLEEGLKRTIDSIRMK